MESREAGLQVLYNRIKDARTVLNIRTFRRNPSNPIKEDDLLCIFMLEQIDRITKPSTRGYSGYPCSRTLEVVFEIICDEDFDIRDFYCDFRSVVLSDPVLASGCIVRETKAVGPYSHNTPNIVGMQLVCEMTYIDSGFII